jgi:RHS repeat-associated protein
MPAYLPIEGNLELVAVYAYDAFNRRVQSILVGIETQVHTWDGWRQVVQHGVEFTGTAWRAAPTKQFVWGARLDELVSYRRKVGSAWETYYVLHGGQDTAVKLVDSSGAVVEQYEYDPYGRVTVYTGSGSLVDLGPAGASPEDGTASAKGLPFLWKGIRLDEVTGLLQMRNRYYSVEMGRFLTRDPLGVWADGTNSGCEVAYVGNNSLVHSDAYGLQAERSGGSMTTPGGHVAEVVIVDAPSVGQRDGKPQAGATFPALPVPPDPARGEVDVQWIRKTTKVRIAGQQSFREFMITWFHEYAHVCAVDKQLAEAKAGKPLMAVLKVTRDDDKMCVTHEAQAKLIVDVIAEVHDAFGGGFNPWR